jgi:hypothetical protein
MVKKLASTAVYPLIAKPYCLTLKPVVACWSVVHLKQFLRYWLFSVVMGLMMQP